jgi:two-component system heavy metal sensor histidine kinase CusS
MLDRLQDSFRRLTEFASDMAHDLRTPINNLLGEAQVALSKPRSAAEYRIAIESAIEEYERLSRMMENMLFLARSDNAKASLSRVSLDASRSVAKVLSYFEMLAEDRSITLVARCESGLTVGADAIMFERALGNLISNALRHALAGSEVTVRAVADGAGGARIEVSNHGPDIAPEYLEVVFDRFRRVGTARESAGGGAGLGLAIVKSIMALHGGSAGVASGGGTTVFTLNFPPA